MIGKGVKECLHTPKESVYVRRKEKKKRLPQCKRDAVAAKQLVFVFFSGRTEENAKSSFITFKEKTERMCAALLLLKKKTQKQKSNNCSDLHSGREGDSFNRKKQKK